MQSLKLILPVIIGCFIISCKSSHPANISQLVTVPAEMDQHVSENVKDVLNYALENNGQINDSMRLALAPVVQSFYQQNEFKNIWSNKENWAPLADSLYNFIGNSRLYGLFPSDYHFKELQNLRNKLILDSTAKTDAISWTKADLLLTDAFMYISLHLRDGRLRPDSIALRSDTASKDSLYINALNRVIIKKQLTSVFNLMEPSHAGYRNLKAGIPRFLDSMDKKIYTKIIYPDNDSSHLVKALQKRFLEGGYTDSILKHPDSAKLSVMIKKVQRKKGLKVDGKISAGLVRVLNITDADRFNRIALTMDRFKQLPDKFPERYIWVNLPSYYLRVWDHDTMFMQSKVIVGKPTTRTPTLNSAITDMVTYPQWTIPNSIIKKDILPGLKKNPDYLAKKGFMLVDAKGNEVDPHSVNWENYTTGIPYKVIQGSGDDNALGILKFNFNNPYSVYLHDTNQRYLFSNTSRALSHGCVRVQDWEKLAFYIARNDSLHQKTGTVLKYTTDSIRIWLAEKVKKRIIMQNRIPLYIRYFTCEGKDNKVIFYDDIYGEDKVLSDKYFVGKNVLL